MHRGYVGPPGGQVHYWTAGDAGPALLMFHESPQAANVFAPALGCLGRRLRAWALDTPGYGQSDPPARPLEIPDYARLLLDAADALGVEQFAVLGQHTGASIALEVALQAGPERVTHAVFSGLAVLDEPTRAQFLRDWAPDLVPAEDGSHLLAFWERYCNLWEAPPELVQLGVANPMTILERYNWAYNAAFRYDPAPGLARLHCPALLLTAERDMLARYDDDAARLLSRATRKRLTDTTGQLPWRVPEEYARIVADFLGAP
jgi:haloalkane dehalogenase